jgi:glycosyltransferase involved in cell wall biosynthesis
LLTRVGGFSEIADDHGAALAVPPDDLTEIARGITKLLDDPTERDRLAAAASALAGGEFAWSSIAERTLALYETLI